MSEFMYSEVRTAILSVFVSPNYVALTCDKVTPLKMGHGYLSMPMWSKIGVVFIFFCFEKVVEGSGLDNLIQVIIFALTGAAKMERLALAKTLLCFGADGVSIF